MNELLAIAIRLLDNPEVREQVIVMGEKAFDEYIEPVDLPGPDAALDPLIRKAIRPTIGVVYDAIINKLKERASAV